MAEAGEGFLVVEVVAGAASADLAEAASVEVVPEAAGSFYHRA